jgi:NIMA (never in mitosis gene a)-related kinase
LKGEPYNQKTDIWALGLILYELCTANKAFQEGTEEGLKQRILSFTIPSIPSGGEARPSLKDLD